MILVIAPHADDEAIGCGGFIRRQSEKGHQVEVILLASPHEGDIRVTEYQHSLNCLGVSDSICFGFIEQSIQLTPDAVVRLLTLIESRRPKLILCPHHEEQDVDHKRAAAMVHAVMKINTLKPVPWVLHYEVWTPMRHPDFLIDITRWQEAKENAICCYATQQSCRDYAAGALGINSYRAVFWGSGKGLCEAYTISHFDGQDDLEALWSYLG